jgi:hypothetical protein
VLGSASPLEDAESCVYGYGALKFLTMNNVLLAKVLKVGILELMVLHIKMVNSVVSYGMRTSQFASPSQPLLVSELSAVSAVILVKKFFYASNKVQKLLTFYILNICFSWPVNSAV